MSSSRVRPLGEGEAGTDEELRAGQLGPDEGSSLQMILFNAHTEGVQRHRRIQRPIVALLALSLAGLGIYGYFYVSVESGSARRVAVLRTLPILIAVLAATPVLLFLMLTHTQPRRVTRTICVVVAIFLASPLKLAFDLYLLFSGGQFATSLEPELGACVSPSDASCGEGAIVLIVLALMMPALYVVAALVLVATLLRRPSTGVLIARLQKVLVALNASAGVVRLARLVVKFGTIRGFDGSASEDLPDCVFGIYLLVALVAYSETIRVRVRAWLASIGGQMSSAVCIAELLGAGHVHSLGATAQSRFTCVYACDVTVEGFTSEGDPDSAQKVRPTHFGSCDCFVSHSWNDDPHAKHAAFVLWADDFRARYHREPTVWIDRYCLDLRDFATSISCLPIFIVGCSRLLVLRGPTVLSRLWCIVELFTFVVMSGSTAAVDVVPFGEVVSLESVTLRRGSGSSTSTHSDRADERDRFDARRARCGDPEDYIPLMSVLHAYPSGISVFNRELLATLRSAEGRWFESQSVHVNRGAAAAAPPAAPHFIRKGNFVWPCKWAAGGDRRLFRGAAKLAATKAVVSLETDEVDLGEHSLLTQPKAVASVATALSDHYALDHHNNMLSIITRSPISPAALDGSDCK